MNGLEQVLINRVVLSLHGIIRLGKMFQRAVGDNRIKLPIPGVVHLFVVDQANIQSLPGTMPNLRRRDGDAGRFGPSHLSGLQDAPKTTADIEQTRPFVAADPIQQNLSLPGLSFAVRAIRVSLVHAVGEVIKPTGRHQPVEHCVAVDHTGGRRGIREGYLDHGRFLLDRGKFHCTGYPQIEVLPLILLLLFLTPYLW